MISVCVITKNEKENLERCLRSFSAYPFELVVVDTGSSDDTLSMARQYTQSVYEFPWCDDFSKAKNYAVSKAKNDIVLVIDSDEFLCSIDFDELCACIQKFPARVGRILRVNQMEQNQEIRKSKEYINRLFDRRLYHYVGKIHEQLTAIDGMCYDTYCIPLVIEHTGYLLTKQARQKKAERNIKLLKQELKNKKDPYILYQLGKSYYMLHEYQTAADYFNEALSFDLDPDLEYVVDMVDCFGYALINSGQAAAALSFEQIYDTFGVRADFQFLMGLIYMNNEQFENAVQEFLKAAAQKDGLIFVVNSYLAYYNAGVIYECLGKKEEAAALYQKCESYLPAKKRLLALANP